MTTKRKSITTISDPLLEPYFITKDEYSYAVKQNVTSDANHFRAKEGTAKTYEKSLYYYPRMEQALMKIASLKSDTGNFSSLEEYINNYKQMSNNLKQYVDERVSSIL
jgi:hypothetical protein|tara:strand:+ start:342 stop:665 length:324 start_codon:yes stop_codon:yes gene_type:complete